MRSTGEVMGIDTDFSKAYAKAALSAGQKLPASGNVFVSMTDKFKEAIVPIAKELNVGTSTRLNYKNETDNIALPFLTQVQGVCSSSHCGTCQAHMPACATSATATLQQLHWF